MTAVAFAATVEDALLQDILREPDDDGLRLILADYLEDHGDPERASFIRDQIELEKIRWGTLGLVLDRCVNYLRTRGDEHAGRMVPPPIGTWYPLGLSHDNERNWDRGERFGCSLCCTAPIVELFFRKGFVWRVHCECRFWNDHGPALVRKSPIRHVHLTDMRVTRLVGGDFYTVHPDPWPWPWMRHKDSITNRTFATVEELRVALSEEVLEWARAS